MNSHLMQHLSWVDYRRRILDDEAIVLLPCGALEQHGPHLPLGTDALLSSAVALDVARQLGGIVAPAFNYGYRSQPKCGGGQHFCGTTSLDGNNLSQMTRDVISEFARHGVRRLALIDGHYENQWFLTEGIELAMRDLSQHGTRTPPLRVVRLEYWDFLTGPTLAKVFPEGFPGFALEHAAVMETSMMLHYHPDLVSTDKIPDEAPADFPAYDTYPTRTGWVPLSGVLSSARGASAEKGGLLAQEVAERVAAALRAEFSDLS
ncbi:creatininase [Paraburkholderia sp. JHI869]|uniref:creatininase n=1 Tax=Paraburkholderia sp. JHI869 TaxID=3112959 RepID=UPI00316F3DA7